MNETLEREPIGLKDVNGNDIHLGDLVEFFACPVHGASDKPSPCAVKMIDFVTRVDAKTPIPGHYARTYFFVNWAGHSAFAKDLSKFCRVVGTFPKDARIFVEQIPRILLNDAAREKLIVGAREVKLAVVQE